MKSLLISLAIVAILLALSLKAWFGDKDQRLPEKSAPGARFIKQCEEVAATQQAPEDYCRCLWAGGVQDLSTLFTSTTAQAISRKCGGKGPAPP